MVKEQARGHEGRVGGEVGQQVRETQNVTMWMVEYAAKLLHRREVGKDGKSAHERLKGKQAAVPGIEFGAKVMFKKTPTRKGVQTWSSM